VLGWVAVGLSILLSCFWAFWGVIENFHEGWYYDSMPWNLGLMILQYLSPMLLFMAGALVAIHWPRLGGALHAMAGLPILWRFRPLFGTAALLIAGPLLLIGMLYCIGRPRPRKLAGALIIGLPVLVLMVCGIGPAIRVAARFDDGNLEIRLVQGNGVRLIWAPDGPGWPRRGVTWHEAVRRCQYLTEDGTTLADTPQNIWRLPTVEEAVQSMARHGENCAGTWDVENAKAVYQIVPDKESPLWNIHSQVIYWWTGTQIDDERAYIIVYDGKVWPRRKQHGPGYLGFRAVRAASAES
jgi:hypothetical protein